MSAQWSICCGIAFSAMLISFSPEEEKPIARVRGVGLWEDSRSLAEALIEEESGEMVAVERLRLSAIGRRRGDGVVVLWD